MLAKVWSAATHGIDAVRIVIEVDAAQATTPGFTNPMIDATELEIHSRTGGRMALASGFASHGEPVSCVRAKSGRITELKLGGSRFYPAAKVAREMEARYGKKAVRKRRRR